MLILIDVQYLQKVVFSFFPQQNFHLPSPTHKCYLENPETLANCCNVASSSLFYRYYFGRCASELAQLVPLTYSRGRSTCYSDRLHDLSVTIPRCYKDVYVNSFFPQTARLWNSLPIKCFLLTYNLNGFKSRINRHLLTVGFF